jgi:hypothetical protein
MDRTVASRSLGGIEMAAGQAKFDCEREDD